MANPIPQLRSPALTLTVVLSAFMSLPSCLLAQRPLGVDVSHYQGTVTWTSVKNSGISFGWAKSTEGSGTTDAYFAGNVSGAKAAGVLIGAYHFAHPEANTPAAEANFFWNVAGSSITNDGLSLHPVLDFETFTAPGGIPIGATSYSDWANQWCNAVVSKAAALGITVKPMIYTSRCEAANFNTSVAQWPPWIASLNGLSSQTESPWNATSCTNSTYQVWGTGVWSVWQYSWTGTVPGISGDCDLDVFNGTAAGLTNLVVGSVIPLSPPTISSQPSSRYVDRGSAITMRVAASGNLPLKYQWRLNGTSLANATNTMLPLVNIQTNNAGAYTVVITNNDGKATSSVATLTVNQLYAPVFADNFDTNSSANWTFNRAGTDNRATFAYDYAGIGVASAPNSTGGTTKGLRFEANLSLGVTNALSVSPAGQGFPTNSRLHFDMWINVNGPLPAGGVGSTEAITAGVGTTGTRVQWNLASAAADGVWFSVNGEGGVTDANVGSGDFLAYNGGTLQPVGSGVYAAGTGSTARGNGDLYYQNVFPGGQTPPASQQSGYPQQTGALNSGTVGLAWRDVVVSRNGNTVEWFIDGLKIATVTSALTASNIFVGYWDPFTSVSDNTNLSFGLVDNLRVEVPAVAPVFATQPQSLWARIGSNTTLTASATGLPSPAYQWKFNGTNITGATNASLLLSNLQGTNAGLYSVLVTNIAGSLMSSNGLLSLIAGSQPTLQLIGAPGSLQLNCLGDAGATYALETSTNLINWSTLTNMVAPAASFQFTPASSAGDLQRYYRLRSGL